VVAGVIKVLIVDDQELVRTGFRMILEAHDDIDVVAEAADGEQAIALATQTWPDVVLMDIRMPGLDGLEATRRLLSNNGDVHVLILTTFDSDEYVYEALKAGAAGFLLKSAPSARLVEGVRLVASGEALLAPTLTKRLIAEYVRRPVASETLPDQLKRLTERELEVLRLMARGLSNAEIAAEFVVGAATVKTHVNRVLQKLGVRDRVQAVVLAYECGLVQPGESWPAARR
jgi:DNA-binding NarL/FixJ family response regulator